MTRGFKDVQRKLKRAQRKVPNKVADAAERGAKSINRTAQRRLMIDDAIASGQLLNAFYERRYNNRIIIGNDAPYAKYVEYGTGIYFGASPWPVPVGLGPYKSADFSSQLIVAIMQWARVKPTLHIQNNLRGFAVAVAKEIDEKGTEAQPFWRPAVSTGKYEIKGRSEAAFSRELNRIFK